MAKLQLTWMPGPTPRWRKKYGGKLYYFSGLPSKAASYKKAVAEWNAKKALLDEQADPIEVERAELLRAAKKIILKGNAEQLRQTLADAAAAFGISFQLGAGEGPELRPILDKFLAEKRAAVETGQITGGRYDNLRRSLEHFAEWHGERLNIDANTIPDYRNHCLSRGATIAAERLSCLKQFLRFCWEREFIDQLPRTFKAGVQAPGVKRKPKVWDLATYRALYKKAPDRIKLYLLLQLNCGMYSGDLSDLRPDEVDWKAGTIHRSRSKTPDNEPTTWKLWPETLKLLKKLRAGSGERVLLTETGKPLNIDELRSDGHRKRFDSVRQSFIRWCKANGYPNPPLLKELRKTGATLIARQYGDAVAVAYLGHAPKTVAQRHYLAVSLDDALAWLREQAFAAKGKGKSAA